VRLSAEVSHLSRERREANQQARRSYVRSMPNRWKDVFRCAFCHAQGTASAAVPNMERMAKCTVCDEPNVVVFLDGKIAGSYCTYTEWKPKEEASNG
jgi:transcription elongation factor Elf1